MALAWRRWLARPGVKTAVLLAASLPMVWLWGAALTDQLGANPAEALVRGLGDWTLRMLCLALAVSPLRRRLQLAALAAWRRGLGLWAFAYALCHLLAYAWLDMGLDLPEIWADIVQRPFIAVGMGALVLLLVLALTSFDRAVAALGARRWRLLHRAVHVAAGLALLHFFWMRSGKRDFDEVAVYALVLGLCWVERVWFRLRARVPDATGRRWSRARE
jgi:methionine sulfoxide reductase heme-binding subunit